MRNIIAGIILGLLAGGAITWTVLRNPSAAANSSDQKKPEAKEESRVQRAPNGDTVIKLEKKIQGRIGLKTAPLQAVQLPPEVKGYGHVLDPTPFATLLAEGASARASLEASTKEYQRLKKLFDQNQNVSSREVETAEAIMKRDKIQAEAVQTRWLLALGKTAAAQTNLSDFVENLVLLKTALARIDLPLGQALDSPPVDGRLAPAVAPEKSMLTRYLGPVAFADPQTQGQGYLFLIASNPPPSGAALAGWLLLPGESQNGVIVPRAALLRHEGAVFVFVQTGDETFQRKEAPLERPLESGWFVRQGLSQTDKVVIVGAQDLLSEEQKSQGGGEE